MAFGLDAKKKSHRHRKNPRSHELYREENKRQNAERPKQITITDELADGTVIIKGPFRE